MSQDHQFKAHRQDCRDSPRPMTIPWPPLLLISALAGAVLLGWFLPLNWPGYGDITARVVGVGIGVAGLLLIGWAAYHLHLARTTILPHKSARVLVRSGPFIRFRNPIYLGDVMLLLGAAELTQNIWFVASAVLFAISVTLLAIVPEEHHLEQKFGEEYRAYKARTRRWI